MENPIKMDVLGCFRDTPILGTPHFYPPWCPPKVSPLPPGRHLRAAPQRGPGRNGQDHRAVPWGTAGWNKSPKNMEDPWGVWGQYGVWPMKKMEPPFYNRNLELLKKNIRWIWVDLRWHFCTREVNDSQMAERRFPETVVPPNHPSQQDFRLWTIHLGVCTPYSLVEPSKWWFNPYMSIASWLDGPCGAWMVSYQTRFLWNIRE